MREFETGATRDNDQDKHDPHGALDPGVLKAFTAYMHRCSFLPDGTTRPASNWKKGITKESYMKSLTRHFLDLWELDEGKEVRRPETGELVNLNDCLGGIFFNLAGYWRTVLQERETPTADLASIDAAHLERQRTWSRETFGPGARLLSVVDHIRKELKEIEDNPKDVSEWADVLILAFDGAWRAGWEPQEIVDAVIAKQTKNEGRTWPDWRTSPPNQAIEHDRGRADRARLKYGCDDPDKCFAKGLHREVV